jgi:hypothetical protein
MCKHAPVACRYGCEASLKQMDVSKHEADNKEAHLRMVVDKVVELQNMSAKQEPDYAWLVQLFSDVGESALRNQDEAAQLQENVDTGSQIVQNKIAENIGKVSSLESLMIEVRNLMSYPFVFKIADFSKRQSDFVCQPFYTKAGYHMFITVLLKGPDISIYASLVSGEFDDSASWPLVGEVVFMILNQQENKHHHVRMAVVEACDDMRVGSPLETCGFHRFISREELQQKSEQYFVDDTLYFQIINTRDLTKGDLTKGV